MKVLIVAVSVAGTLALVVGFVYLGLRGVLQQVINPQDRNKGDN